MFMRIEAARSSKMPLSIYQTTQNHIPDDSNLHSHFRDGLGSHAECMCVSVSLVTGPQKARYGESWGRLGHFITLLGQARPLSLQDRYVRTTHH